MGDSPCWHIHMDSRQEVSHSFFCIYKVELTTSVFELFKKSAGGSDCSVCPPHIKIVRCNDKENTLMCLVCGVVLC